MLTISGLGLAPPVSLAPNPSNPVISPTPAPYQPRTTANAFTNAAGITAIMQAAQAGASQPSPAAPPSTVLAPPSTTPAAPAAPTSFLCPDGVTTVTDLSQCPQPATQPAAPTGPAATGPAFILCSDGVTQVSDPSQCPSAAPAPGMQITPSLPPGAAIAPPMYACPDGSLTPDPTMASCPIVVPTILGVPQTTFLIGAAAILGVGAWLLLRK